MAQENCSCTDITIHFITHGSGAVAAIRFACPCTAEALSGVLVVWRPMVGAALVDAGLLGETIVRTPETLKNGTCFSSLSSSRFFGVVGTSDACGNDPCRDTE